MPSAHCVSTVDGIIVSVDQNFLLLMGRSELDVVGKSYRELTDLRDLDRSAAMLRALIAKAPPVRLQKRYVRPDGTIVHANVLTTRFTNPDRLISTLYWSDVGRELPPIALWETALGIRHVQQVRRVEFGASLFNDGVDAIILELYLAEAEGRIITVTELMDRGPVSGSITLRWITHLCSIGILESNCDPDADVSFTNDGMAKMERMLGSIARLPYTVSKLN